MLNLSRLRYDRTATGALENSLEPKLLRQIRILQVCIVLLLLAVAILWINMFYPLLPIEHFRAIDAQQVNILEKNGIVKAKLSNAAGFHQAYRASHDAPLFSGLMFYNNEGEETGGLVYYGHAIPGGQDSDVSLTMDQYRQDQNVYLNHTEHVDKSGQLISDGLQINSRPDWTRIKQEYGIDEQLSKLPPDQQKTLKEEALRNGLYRTRRLFIGVRRGNKENVQYDNAGLFIRNRLGQDAIKLYVDYNNKPHLELYDSNGKIMNYELTPAK